MLRNVAGQTTLGVQMRDLAGAPLNADVSAYLRNDLAATWTPADIAGGGVLVNGGAGDWNYEPTQAETDADVVRVQYRHASGLTALESYDTRISTIVAETVPVEKTRDSDVLTTGTQTGTSANTLVRDGTYWQITSAAAGIDAELVFNIGTNGNENPSTLQVFGRFDSGKDRQTVIQAFNFDLNAWEIVGTEVMLNENSDKAYIWGLGRSFVRRGQAGTPGSDGDVRVKFLYSSAVSNKVQAGDNLYLDKVAVYYTREAITLGEIVQALVEANPSRNYPDSAIVINYENGQPGTKFGVNGTNGKPSSNLADAIALANTGGYTKFIIEGDTSIVLTQAFPDWTFHLAQGSVIDINGQDVDNSTFVGGTIQGVIVAASTGIRALRCVLKGLTGWGVFEKCKLPQADSLIANGNQVYLLDCESIRPGATNPSIKGGSVAGLSLSVIKYGGGIDIGGLGAGANVTISGTGSFQLTDTGPVTATVIRSGNIRQIGADPAGVTVIDTARVTQATPMKVDDSTPLKADLTHMQGFAIPGAVMIEDDGAGDGRFTAKALEQAPSGGGGGTDWSALERAQIRYRLNMDGTRTAPTEVPADPNSNATNMRGTDGAVTSLAGVALEATSQDIKSQTDKMLFDGNNYIGSTPQTTVDVGAVGGIAVTGPDDLKADVSGLAQENGGRLQNVETIVTAQLTDIENSQGLAYFARVWTAVLAGQASGLETATGVYKSPYGANKTRLTAQGLDNDGNRAGPMTLDGTP